MPQINVIPSQTVNETIASVLHQLFDESMNIVVARIKEEERTHPTTNVVSTVEVIDSSVSVEDFAVSENNYVALMSASPSWSPSKPAGVYSEEDLWIVVEAQRSGTDLDIGTV